MWASSPVDHKMEKILFWILPFALLGASSSLSTAAPPPWPLAAPHPFVVPPSSSLLPASGGATFPSRARGMAAPRLGPPVPRYSPQPTSRGAAAEASKSPPPPARLRTIKATGSHLALLAGVCGFLTKAPRLFARRRHRVSQRRPLRPRPLANVCSA
eukprot:GHVT01000617.1.p1 GENE.GHVT01000617.1~~GHVT01000617.1.p1  ORF type:complete len:157 (+),score=32.44 GHVT01000617.1:1354-1824(+)